MQSKLKSTLLVILCLAITSSTYYCIFYLKRSSIAEDFYKNAAIESNLIKKELEVILSITESVRSFFYASDFVSKDEFKSFVTPYLTKYHDIIALQWVPVEENNESATNYPILYSEPFIQNTINNQDLGSNANTLKALETARDTNQANFTNLNDITNNKLGFEIILPVYKNPNKLKNIYDYRENITGFVIALCDINQIYTKTLNAANYNFIVNIQKANNLSSIQNHINNNQFIYNQYIEIEQNKWLVTIFEKLNPLEIKLHIEAIIGSLTVLILFLIIFFWVRQIKLKAKIIEEQIKAKTREISQNNKMLAAISDVQSLFISGEAPEFYFDKLLQYLLDFSGSKYGFIGEILINDTQKYLRTVAITNIAWNYETRKFYQENSPTGLKFYNLNTLFGEVIKTGKIVISNDPANDTRSGGLPEGHPDMNSFLGIPFLANNRLIGMAGVANRAGGYDDKILQQLAPLISTCEYVINEYKIQAEHRQMEQENFKLARYDVLTEIPNRALFEKEYPKLAKLCERNNQKLALLFIDLDNFKPINDNLGHDVGDKVLQVFAKIMQDSVRDSDFIARIGGDEFAIIVPAIKDTLEPKYIAKNLINKCNQQIEILDNHEIKISMSIGISILPDHTKDLELLRQLADTAMYSAKKAGKNRYFMYNDVPGANSNLAQNI